MNLLFWVCLAFMAGTYCGLSFNTEDIISYSLLFFNVLIIKLIIFGVKNRKLEHTYTALFLTFLFLGIISIAAYKYYCFSDVSKLYGTYAEFDGVITETDDTYFTVKCGNRSYTVLYYNNEENYSENDVVKIKGRLEPYPHSQYYGDVDRAFYYALRGNYGKINPSKIIKTGKSDSKNLTYIGIKLRNIISNRIDRYADDKNAGLIKALLTGNTKYLPDELKENFALSGISHLIAVSGLHLGIFMSFFFFVTSKFSRKKILKTILIFLLILMYSLIIRERASLIRAGIMIASATLLKSLCKRPDSLVNLAVTGMIICILNPFYIIDAGFVLSFNATLGIVLFSGFFKNKTIAVPVIALIFMAPFTVYYYNMISPVSIIANIVILVFVPALIIFGYIGCIIPFFFIFSDFLAGTVTHLSSVTASIDFLRFNFASPGIWLFALWFLIICFMYLIQSKNDYLDALSIMNYTIIFFAFTIMFSYNNLEPAHIVKYINSGNYNFEHIKTSENADILIDCGYNTKDYFIKSGTDKIDMIIITDNHKSKLNALVSLCENTDTNIDIKYIMLPTSLKNSNLMLEKGEILYYNQNECICDLNDLKIDSVNDNNFQYIEITAYNNSICIPVDTNSINTDETFNVICIPDGCKDCSEYHKDRRADFYIVPTYNYDYFSNYSKYITPLCGGVTMNFYKYKSIEIE
ncbi:MAG: ComEC/Rec2 family competence protein [Clostridia bacterium]|nr:ComEC/Rec2 family competence protein [Clostridia bacterium]